MTDYTKLFRLDGKHALVIGAGSGIGREGPRFAIEELTVTRMAVIRPSARR